MHLMLRATDEHRNRVHDVVATIEADHTIDELRRALTELPGLGHTTVLTRAGRPLDPTSTLADVGIVSGEELVLTTDDRRFDRPDPDAVVRLDALAGPASGWSAALTAGTHLLGRPATTGRDEPGHLAIPDAAISRNHLRLEVTPDGRVTVHENPDATNPLRIDGERPDGPLTLEPGRRLQIGDSLLGLSRIETAPTGRLDQLGQIAFHRTPLRPARPAEVVLTPINKIPTEPEPARFSVLTSAAPLIGGILMAFVLREPRFLIFTALAPITALGSYLESRRRNRERRERDVEAFEKRFTEREEALREAHETEERLRHEAAPDLADLRRRAERHDHTLWSRGRDLPEFLDLRIGLGRDEPAITADHAGDGDEEFLGRLEELEERFRHLDDVPVTVPLAEHGVFGIHGPRTEVSGLASALLVQAVCLHSPEDLVIAAAASNEIGILDWLRWTPHTRATGSPLGGIHLTDRRDGADELLRAVLEVAEFRTMDEARNQDRRWPWILLVLDRLVEPDPHLVAQVTDRCPEAGISVLWLSDGPDRIPPQCTVIADVADRRESGDDRRTRLWFTDPDLDNRDVAADGVDHDLADTVARALAPLRDASSGSATSSIPRIVPLFSALGVDEITPAVIQREWAVDRVGDAPYAVEAVVGTSADGPMVLDLVSDGPHGLIGGTSGAGKSELIAALVAGLVAYQSPRDLSLMFIDFKGGSASEVFKDLPHISGRVTDLDESLAIRAQVSLRAELRRRVALFSDHAAKDMADMRRLHPEAAPPSLVIVIDEFATLVAQLPDFVADIIDIAQRGRSYGVHLILATQRPSSSVDDNILANTNLRISLRMLDRVESMSILNAPDAADIAVPLKGRSIARMGPGQLVEFQSAYCSAPVVTSHGRPPVDIRPLDLLPPGAATAPTETPDEGEPRTQLDELIDAVLALDAPPVRRIWNDLLPEHLMLDRAERMPDPTPDPAPREPGRHVLVGGADDPDNQRQLPAVVDLADGGGLLVLGTGGSGKTTVLRTIAASLTRDDHRAGGGAAAFLVLDFSSGELRDLTDLPTCGGIGTLDDLEATTRIIETLAAEVRRRRQLTTDGGDPADRGPTIALLVDGYANLVETLENTGSGQEQATDRWLAEFHRIVLDGRQVGIHTVLTADRGASIRNAIFAAVTRRLVLRQVDRAETSGLGLPATDTFPPGAGFLDGLRVQIATTTPPEDRTDPAPEPEPDPEPSEPTESTGGTPEPARVPLLQPPLPDFVHRPQPTAPLADGDWTGAIGIADITGTEIGFDLGTLDVLVTGPPLSGRSAALRSIAERFEADGRSVFAIGAEDSGLRHFPWRAAAWGLPDVESLLGTMRAELEFPDREALLVVDDLDLLENPAFDTAVAGLGTERSIRVIGSTTGFGYSGNEIVKRVRAARQVLYLQPASAREVAETIGVLRLPLLRLGLPMPQGRAMFVRNRIPTVVQVYAPQDLARPDGTAPPR